MLPTAAAEGASEESHHKPAEPQLNRACDPCRSLKVRCLTDPAFPHGPCQRCTKTGRACVFAPPQRRKPRKRTDARVAELEREVRAMRLMLAEKSKGSSSGRDHGDESSPGKTSTSSTHWNPNVGGGTLGQSIHDGSSPSQSEGTAISLAGDYPHGPLPWNESLDVVERGVMTSEKAEELFQVYLEHYNYEYPGVSLPEGATCAEVRVSKPVLWLACLAAAAQSVEPDLAGSLNEDLVRTMADRVFLKGDKTVELVEALHITVIFYYPPPNSTRLLFYQFSNMALGLCLELGLGSKPSNFDVERHTFHPNSETLLDRPLGADIFERCRCLVSCYEFSVG
jgi:hypothetical protein